MKQYISGRRVRRRTVQKYVTILTEDARTNTLCTKIFAGDSISWEDQYYILNFWLDYYKHIVKLIIVKLHVSLQSNHLHALWVPCIEKYQGLGKDEGTFITIIEGMKNIWKWILEVRISKIWRDLRYIFGKKRVILPG